MPGEHGGKLACCAWGATPGGRAAPRCARFSCRHRPPLEVPATAAACLLGEPSTPTTIPYLPPWGCDVGPPPASVHQLTFTRKTLDKSRQRATPLARLPPALLAGTLHTGALLFSSFQRCRSFSFRTALFGHRGCLMFLNVFDCSGCGVGACGLFFLPEERVAAWRW